METALVIGILFVLVGQIVLSVLAVARRFGLQTVLTEPHTSVACEASQDVNSENTE